MRHCADVSRPFGYALLARAPSSLALAAVIALGCSTKAPKEQASPSASSGVLRAVATGAVKATAVPVIPVATAAKVEVEPAPSAIVLVKPQPATDEAIRAATQAWSDAIVSRSPERLNQTYATFVSFYGQQKTREQVVLSKMKALASAPDFKQVLTDVRVRFIPKDRPVATFEKQWVSGGRVGKVRSWVRFALEQGRWQVTGESDSSTDDMQARAHSLSSSCEKAILALVVGTREARARRATQGPTATREMNGMSIEGVDWPIVMVNIHEGDESGFRNTVAWFSVNAEHATVRERSLLGSGPEVPLEVPEASRVMVQRVCRKP